MTVWMTYNPHCGTARTVLAALRERGIAPEVREYMKEPLTRDEIAALVRQMAVPARQIVRWKETAALAAAGIDAASGEEALLAAMAAHPVLLNRPIVRTPKGVQLCRPAQSVLALL